MVQRLVPPAAVLSERATEIPNFEEIYGTWFHEVARWVRAFGGLDGDIEDLTQEVFLVVRRKLGSFDGRNLSGWLYRLAQRTVGDYRRRAWFRHVIWGQKDGQDKVAVAVAAGDDPSQILERREAERSLSAILSKMSDTRRSAFLLFEVEGYSGEEIAELEGIPVNTVWTRLYHARKDFLRLVQKAREQGWLS